LDAKKECAPEGGQAQAAVLTRRPAFRRMEAMARHRTHSTDFKRHLLAPDSYRFSYRIHASAR